MLLGIEEVEQILDQVAESLPMVLFDELNGGINLLEDAVSDPEFPLGVVSLMGEDCTDVLGCYLTFYYGSLVELANAVDRDASV